MIHRCRLHLVSTQLNIDERILNSGEVGVCRSQNPEDLI